MTVPALIGVLCISNKYSVDLAGNNALNVLHKKFPDSIDQWDDLVSSLDPYYSLPRRPVGNPPPHAYLTPVDVLPTGSQQQPL
jgi:hypothetical protein